MKLTWKEDKNSSNVTTKDNVENVTYRTEVNNCEDATIKSAVEDSIDMSVSLLHKNVGDEALYFLCEWDHAKLTLSIVVTDDKKVKDSPYTVRCCFICPNEKEADAEGRGQKSALSENIKNWIRDYLTTCAGFMDYSLVAIFHSDNRDQCVLL